MTFLSYSQNFEDVMLWRALRDVKNGNYIDVGAHDPMFGSVTKAFYDRGWNGINIEPIADPFERLKSARPRDINLQVCAGARNGEIDIYDVAPSGLATVQLSIAEEYRSKGHSVTVKRVPITTLNGICKEYVDGEIHFLKIDVEGFERDVLQGANLSRFRPWIIVVEATYPNSQEENYSDWENTVIDSGYKFSYFDGLNRFYVAVEHKNLLPCFSTPPNYFDGFALSSTCFFSREVASELRLVEARAEEEDNSKKLIITSLEKKLTDAYSANERLNKGRQQLQVILGIGNGEDCKLVSKILKLKESNEHSNISIIMLSNQLTKANNKIIEITKSKNNLQTTVNTLREEMEKMTARFREESQVSHHWWLEAENLKSELAYIYASKSWLITSPLRKAYSVALIVIRSISSATSSVYTRLKAAIQQAIDFLLLSFSKVPFFVRLIGYLHSIPGVTKLSSICNQRIQYLKKQTHYVAVPIFQEYDSQNKSISWTIIRYLEIKNDLQQKIALKGNNL